jgi:2-hydroxy-4-carboxymuconate semialdehyde hemiacetal dehydrogenase
MDMSIQMKVPSGAICTLSLSFNNDGPLGSAFRYICDKGTYVARYDALFDGAGAPIEVSPPGAHADGVELQDREFITAIRDRREPIASVRQVLAAYETLNSIEKSLD